MKKKMTIVELRTAIKKIHQVVYSGVVLPEIGDLCIGEG